MRGLLELAQRDARTGNIRSRLTWILICETFIAITTTSLLYFTRENKYVGQVEIQKSHEINTFYDQTLEPYYLWRTKFFAMVEMEQLVSLDVHQNMLRNSVHSQRILRIIEEESEDIFSFEDRCITLKPECPRQPPNLRGKLLVRNWLVKMRKKRLREQESYTFPRHPGEWSPSHCTSRHSVAIIIPYRNRRHQLHLLLQFLPRILKKQQVNYSIFVVEQAGNKTFNKGMLMNAGFMTALSRPAHGVPYHCFIFHDSDLLTEDDRNMYTCPEFPRHMSIGVDELDYKLPYKELVGGIFAIKTDHFIRLNGYSNLYWGWGGEDDDMGLRVQEVLKWTMRPPDDLGRITTIPHVKQTPFLTLRLRRLLKTMAKKEIQHRRVEFCKIHSETGYSETTIHTFTGRRWGSSRGLCSNDRI
uniref:Beta-1,4-N-acetylgalactosaminyltransferase n=2 Tax=Lygus hesperus TaxID=30085 RepID=A0A0A9XFF2_LYGHE